MSHEAYRRASAHYSAPRDAEYRAFGEATRRLIEAKATGRENLSSLIDAIHRNRMLWGALAADCSNDRNGLPAATRASIIALSRWVSEHSSAVMRRQEPIEPLIEINRIIMQGLATARPVA